MRSRVGDAASDGETGLDIVFALLAHNKPDIVASLVRLLSRAGHRLVIHLDDNMPKTQAERLINEFAAAA